LKIKLTGRHFDTTEVTEAEPQAVLNSLTQHDFQDAFKNGRRLGTVRARKGTTSRVKVASRPKVSFYEMAAPVPESLYIIRTEFCSTKIHIVTTDFTKPYSEPPS
jgi:hypothetical protein